MPKIIRRTVCSIEKMHLGASGPLCVCNTKEEVELKDRIVQIKSLLLMVRWNYLYSVPSLCLILNKNTGIKGLAYPMNWQQACPFLSSYHDIIMINEPIS